MKKTIFSILGYLFFIQFLSAQITTHEVPFSFGSTPSQLLRSISTQEAKGQIAGSPFYERSIR